MPSWFWPLLRLYSAYKAGHLLAPGAWRDQPAWYTSAIGEIDRMVTTLDHERAEKARQPRGGNA